MGMKLQGIGTKVKGLKKIPQKFKTLNKKIQIIVGIAAIVLAGGGIYALASGGNETTVPQVTIAKVTKGNIKNVITATGTASLTQVMPLSFEKGGTIQEIYVKEGDSVVEGQPLVRLDTTTLEQELKEATESLASAQAGYDQTLGSLERNVKSNLVATEKSLLDAQQKADSYYLENQYHLAELNLKAVEDKLAAAQGAGESDTYQLQVSLSQAQLNLIEAKHDRDGGAAKELEIAQDEYNNALKAAKDYEKGVSKEYLTAIASLTQSETKFVTAEENLNGAILKAPMDGTILSSDVELYQNVGNNNTVLSLVADSKDFTVSASVDQADIGKIKAGQKVDMTLDTAPNENIAGTVSSVSLKGTNSQNVITYKITIKVDEPSDILRDQMSVNVSIVTEEVEDALVIPSDALMTRGNTTGVLVAKGEGQSGESEFVEVEAGIDNGEMVEIISGLSEGETVIIRSTLQSTTTTTNQGNGQRSGGSMGGIGGMGGGGIPSGGGGPMR